MQAIQIRRVPNRLRFCRTRLVGWAGTSPCPLSIVLLADTMRAPRRARPPHGFRSAPHRLQAGSYVPTKLNPHPVRKSSGLRRRLFATVASDRRQRALPSAPRTRLAMLPKASFIFPERPFHSRIQIHSRGVRDAHQREDDIAEFFFPRLRCRETPGPVARPFEHLLGDFAQLRHGVEQPVGHVCFQTVSRHKFRHASLLIFHRLARSRARGFHRRPTSFPAAPPRLPG